MNPSLRAVPRAPARHDPSRRPRTTARGWIPVVLASAAVWPAALHAQDAEAVFDAYAPRVFKVEVLESQSSTPEVVGTAFLAAEGGYLVSNYHVVNDVLFHPERYRIRLEGVAGESSGDVRILAVEPIHDLAILQADLPVDVPFVLDPNAPPVGTRLYSLGHPADLATAVVEGTYNGPVEHSISPRHHFTGSVNPGMSGGPTIAEDGRVVGINVASAGNQLSFLIPSRVAVDLLAEAQTQPRESTEALLDQARETATAFQQAFFGPLLAESLPSRDLSGFTVPVGPDTFDCFTSTLDEDEDEYRGIRYRCSVHDNTWLSNEQWSPFATIQHVRLSSDGLGEARFWALATSWYADLSGWDLTDDEDLTDYACEPGSVRNPAGLKLRVTTCARRHDSLEGLYDAFIRTAVTGVRGQTVISTFQASGVTFPVLTNLVGRVVEGFAWNG